MSLTKRRVLYVDGLGVVKRYRDRFIDRLSAGVVVSVLVMAVCMTALPTDVFADTSAPTSENSSSTEVPATSTDPTTNQSITGSSEPEGSSTTEIVKTEQAQSPEISTSSPPNETVPLIEQSSQSVDDAPETLAQPESQSEVASPESNIQAPSTTPEPDTEITSDTSATNNIIQESSTGDSILNDNDDTGSGVTGDASGSLDLFNTLNNITSIAGSATIEQIPVSAGEIIVDLPSAGPDTGASPSAEGLIAIDANTNISNSVIVDTTSGDATIKDNDDTGSGVTGDALSDVSILNLANTIIATGDVYVGLITIDGDYTGDIILSNDFLKKLQSINYTPGSPADIIDLDITENITNNVVAMAESGSATIENNDDTGSAQSGNAMTYVLIKNFAGSFILYGNSLLIIVNVTGDWIGSLLGLEGANSAMISASGTQNAQGLAVPETSSIPTSIDGYIINSVTNISNNVLASAKSGNATITGNDDVGDAKSGDAVARIQIINIINNVISLGNWLGVIFVNVFGNLYGDIVFQPEQQIETNDNTGQVDSAPLATIENAPDIMRLIRPRAEAGSYVAPQEEQGEQTIVASATTPPKFTSLTEQAENTINEVTWRWILLAVIMSGGLFTGYKLIEAKNESLGIA